jgi:hypothetical protein
VVVCVTQRAISGDHCGLFVKTALDFEMLDKDPQLKGIVRESPIG